MYIMLLVADPGFDLTGVGGRNFVNRGWGWGRKYH